MGALLRGSERGSERGERGLTIDESFNFVRPFNRFLRVHRTRIWNTGATLATRIHGRSHRKAVDRRGRSQGPYTRDHSSEVEETEPQMDADKRRCPGKLLPLCKVKS